MSLIFDSINPPQQTESSASPVRWELIFEGVWVARRGADFAGMVQSAARDCFKLTDERGYLIGRFESFEEARNELNSAPMPRVS